MDDYLRKHRDEDQSHAFKATGELSGKIFSKELKQVMNEASKHSGPSLVMVDKNHPPNAVHRTMKVLQKVPCKVIALVPRCPTPAPEYPFSYSMLVQCFLRCQFRDGHQTLSNEDPDLLTRVMFGFFKAYHNVKFDA
mmetsp:Transcript_34786/g.25943  ORF Transcript_34786/g.25943 Transcript_34786/m.25943 type:complete len:137 (-) Transcript_34786:156-566(-)